MGVFRKKVVKFDVFFKKRFIYPFLYKDAETLMVEEFLLSSWNN